MIETFEGLLLQFSRATSDGRYLIEATEDLPESILTFSAVLWLKLETGRDLPRLEEADFGLSDRVTMLRLRLVQTVSGGISTLEADLVGTSSGTRINALEAGLDKVVVRGEKGSGTQVFVANF